ncbi:MAG: acetylglutamate kinase [Fibrobacterales bacterium]|nr:acetylglutamate kinase [Fibrobacterales bacterium]
MAKTRVLVKIGGSLAEDRRALSELCSALAEFSRSGADLALVHGGGKEINRNLELLAEKPRFEGGLRVTDEPAMKMVEMTLSGWVNKELVRLLLGEGCRAVGISGVDGGQFVARKRGGTPDLGRVGKIVSADGALVEHLWAGGWLPVVSPVSNDDERRPLNINADEAASALAVALKADRLLFVSDVPGVMRDGETIPELDEAKIAKLVEEGVISGGMIPKTRSCLEGIAAGIGEVHICGWNGRDGFLDQLSGARNRGTIIR